MELIEPGATVGCGGSVTIRQLGLLDILAERGNTVIHHWRDDLPREEVNRLRKEAMFADVYLSSSNAITLQGQLVNTDGVGNRVAAMIFGPPRVIVLAGYNKIVADEEQARERIKNVASPQERPPLRGQNLLRPSGPVHGLQLPAPHVQSYGHSRSAAHLDRLSHYHHRGGSRLLGRQAPPPQQVDEKGSSAKGGDQPHWQFGGADDRARKSIGRNEEHCPQQATAGRRDSVIGPDDHPDHVGAMSPTKPMGPAVLTAVAVSSDPAASRILFTRSTSTPKCWACSSPRRSTFSSRAWRPTMASPMTV